VEPYASTVERRWVKVGYGTHTFELFVEDGKLRMGGCLGKLPYRCWFDGEPGIPDIAKMSASQSQHHTE
jgi:hypothetical protein